MSIPTVTPAVDPATASSTAGLEQNGAGLTTLAGGDSENIAAFNAMMADYKAANRELQAMNFAFKKLEGVVGLENRISQAKIG